MPDEVIDQKKETKLRRQVRRLMRRLEVTGICIMLGGVDGESSPVILFTGTEGRLAEVTAEEKAGKSTDEILDLMRQTLRTSVIAVRKGRRVSVRLGRRKPDSVVRTGKG